MLEQAIYGYSFDLNQIIAALEIQHPTIPYTSRKDVLQEMDILDISLDCVLVKLAAFLDLLGTVKC